ncbi:unnamed protein product [Arabis nemorensis]|uniref:Uncharacterized protein n=1 Tax=Arabis nemorensis TaxID=586526 RepID=A0A565BLT2_9BRAS|nr:unnamed protein product [Arabis nemorensis]
MMSVSSEDEPQLVEEPTPTKNKRPAPTGKASKAKKAKSSAAIKAEWVKGNIAHRLCTRTQGKVAAPVTTAEGSGESDSGVPPAGTTKPSKQNHAKPAVSHISDDTDDPVPPFLLRYEAHRKVILNRDQRYPEFKKNYVSPHNKKFVSVAAEERHGDGVMGKDNNSTSKARPNVQKEKETVPDSDEEF